MKVNIRRNEMCDCNDCKKCPLDGTGCDFCKTKAVVPDKIIDVDKIDKEAEEQMSKYQKNLWQKISSGNEREQEESLKILSLIL